MKLTSQITEMVSAKITQGKWTSWIILSMQLNIRLKLYLDTSLSTGVPLQHVHGEFQTGG